MEPAEVVISFKHEMKSKPEQRHEIGFTNVWPLAKSSILEHFSFCKWFVSIRDAEAMDFSAVSAASASETYSSLGKLSHHPFYPGIKQLAASCASRMSGFAEVEKSL